tara:strand:- start:72967 stop:73461 length:495 start_codon:yes stop_codon:yes gene_type:complete
MPFIKYDPSKDPESNTSNIRGYWDTAPTETENVIEIDERQAQLWKADPNSFKVNQGKLVAIRKQHANFSKELALNAERKQVKKSLFEAINHKGYTYPVSPEFITNLNLALGICALDKKHKAKFWCNKDGWEFKEHSPDEVLSLAKAFSSRREENSAKLYKNRIS